MRGETTITIFGRRAVLEAIGAESVEVERVLVDRATPAAFRKDLRAACRDTRSGDLVVDLIEADRREVVLGDGAFGHRAVLRHASRLQEPSRRVVETLAEALVDLTADAVVEQFVKGVRRGP